MLRRRKPTSKEGKAVTAGKPRRLFPGSNTARGFHSFFDYLAGPGVDWRFILKGGPGVGKSTFMGRIAETLLEKGYGVEFFHCSSDPDSLDGVSIPALGVAFLDGTAPHVVDPTAPGAAGEIINLGAYWDGARLREKRQEIRELNGEIARLFRLAYRCLAHAQLYVQEIETYYTDAVKPAALRRLRQEMGGFLLGQDHGQGEGAARHLFASAVTPRGVVNRLSDALGEARQVVVIRGCSKHLGASLIEGIYREALDRGCYVEAFHCGLLPEYLEHLFFPELGAAVVTSNPYHPFPVSAGCRVIDLDQVLEARIPAAYQKDLEAAAEGLEAAIRRGVGFIARAKEIHDALEQLYVPGMDFASIDALRQEVTERILRTDASRCRKEPARSGI